VLPQRAPLTSDGSLCCEAREATLALAAFALPSYCLAAFGPPRLRPLALSPSPSPWTDLRS